MAGGALATAALLQRVGLAGLLPMAAAGAAAVCRTTAAACGFGCDCLVGAWWFPVVEVFKKSSGAESTPCFAPQTVFVAGGLPDR